MFSGCTVPPISKETELGSSDQEASPSAGNNTGVVLVPCCTRNCVVIAISGGLDISEVLGCFFNPFLTQLIMSILSKGCKPDHFESHDSLKLRFTNICGLQSNFVECVSFLELNALEILALCETDLDDSIDSGNFCVTGYLSLIRKDSVTHMHGLAVYVKEGLPFAWDLSLEKSTDSYLCFDWLYFTQCLTSSSSFNSFLRLYPWFLILFHLT